MKKRIAVVAIATLMADCLINVGTVSAAEPTEITFWHYMSEDKEGKFVNEAIEEFNNSQDEVHVTAQYLPSAVTVTGSIQLITINPLIGFANVNFFTKNIASRNPSENWITRHPIVYTNV